MFFRAWMFNSRFFVESKMMTNQDLIFSILTSNPTYVP